MAVRTTHARRAHRQTGTTSVAVRVAQTPLAGRDNHVTEAAVMGSMAAAQAQAQATASTTTRAAELMVYGKTLLATRTLQAMGRGGWRRISRVNVVEFKRDAAPILLRCLSLPDWLWFKAEAAELLLLLSSPRFRCLVEGW